MTTSEIPREDWSGFFADFSRRHKGWIVTLEVAGEDIGVQEETIQLPLLEITADMKDHENQLAIILGGQPDADLNHFIDKPVRVWARSSDLEHYDALEVESEGGRKTRLQFQFVSVDDTDHQLPKSR
jgi:hypothetical protein